MTVTCLNYQPSRQLRTDTTVELRHVPEQVIKRALTIRQHSYYYTSVAMHINQRDKIY